jgi:hypothetical protein
MVAMLVASMVDLKAASWGHETAESSAVARAVERAVMWAVSMAEMLGDRTAAPMVARLAAA